MKIRNISVELEPEFRGGAKASIKMMVDSGEGGRETLWRTWTVQVGPIPTDPLEAWKYLQAIVAALVPPQPNEDTGLTHETRKIPLTPLAIMAIDAALAHR